MAEPVGGGGLEEIVRRNLLALAKVNVKYDRHLEVIGSIHIRSDNVKVAGFMIDEHCFKDTEGIDHDRHCLLVRSQEQVNGDDGSDLEDAEIGRIEYLNCHVVKKEVLDEENNNDEYVKNGSIQRHRFPIDHRIDKRCSRSKARQNLSPRFQAIVNSTTGDELQIKSGKFEAADDAELAIADIENDAVCTEHSNHNGLPQVQNGDLIKEEEHIIESPKKKNNQDADVPNSTDMETCESSPIVSSSQAADVEVSKVISITPVVPVHTLQVPHLLLSPVHNTTGASWGVPQSQSPWLASNLPVSTSNLFSTANSSKDLSLSPTADTRGQYDCPFCGMMLANRNNLKNHINSVHTHSKSYVCHICGKVYYSNSALNIHRRRNHYTLSKRYKCFACGKAFKIKSDLSAHMCEVHSRQKEFEMLKLATQRGSVGRMREVSLTSADSDVSSDELCSRKRLSSADAKENENVIKEAESTENVNEGGEKVIEDVQNSQEDDEESNNRSSSPPGSITEMVGIVTVSQSESDPESEPSQSPVSKRKKVAPGLGFPCNLCDSVLSSKHNLQVHIKSVHIRDRIYSCEHCGKTSYSQSAIRIHRSRHHGNGKACKCDVCGAEFKIASDLAAHLNRKHQIFSKK